MAGRAPDLVAARLSAQLLAGPPATSVEAVVGQLLAVQAQDARGARLAVRARSRGLTAVDVDRALSEDRTLVVSWLNRGTLHLVTAEDYWWLEPILAPRLVTANARRLRQEGVSERQADRGVEVVVAALAEGPCTRAELGARLDAAGVPTAGQALVHVLVAATIRARVVRGPVVDGDHAFVAAEAWLGPPPAPVERAEALARLARRYLDAHGPATATDLATWAGLPLGDARRGLAAIAEETAIADETAVADEATPAEGLLRLLGARRGRRRPAPRLLGPFDPLLHGWRSREPFVGGHGTVVTRNGVFRPVGLVDGRVVATWGLAGGTVTIRPLEAIPPSATAALAEDALDVLRYLGLPPRSAVVESAPPPPVDDGAGTGRPRRQAGRGPGR